jgi:hypothetical protein
MSRQKRTAITVTIVVTTIFFLLTFLAAVSNGYGDGILFIFFSFAIWVSVVFSCILIILKAFRIFATVFGLFLIGLPIAVLLAMLNQGPSSMLLFAGFLAGWTLLSGVLTRSAKGAYWTLHLAGWILGFGLAAITPYILSHYYNYYYYSSGSALYWFLLPIGISTVLGAQYHAVIAFLARFKIFHKAEVVMPQPLPTQDQSQPPQAYQQGYQAEKVYEEGGKIFAYQPQESYPHQEQPQAQYPRGAVQQ